MVTEQELLRALQNIIDNRNNRALNYCVGYTRAAIHMILQGKQKAGIRHQLLYVLSNMSYWRGGIAKETRAIIRNYVG